MCSRNLTPSTFLQVVSLDDLPEVPKNLHKRLELVARVQLASYLETDLNVSSWQCIMRHDIYLYPMLQAAKGIHESQQLPIYICCSVLVARVQLHLKQISI